MLKSRAGIAYVTAQRHLAQATQQSTKHHDDDSMIIPDIILLEDGKHFALTFAYNALLVSKIRRLGTRRWNKELKRWEVGLGELENVMRLFGRAREQVSPHIWRKYQIERIRGSRVRMEVGAVQSKITGEGLPHQRFDDELSFFVPGYQFMPRFIEGKW